MRRRLRNTWILTLFGGTVSAAVAQPTLLVTGARAFHDWVYPYPQIVNQPLASSAVMERSAWPNGNENRLRIGKRR